MLTVVRSEGEKTEADLRQTVVLSNSEWHRLQASVNGINQHNRSVIAAAQQREALHMRSKELVKHWSNTIAVSSTALYASVDIMSEIYLKTTQFMLKVICGSIVICLLPKYF